MKFLKNRAAGFLIAAILFFVSAHGAYSQGGFIFRSLPEFTSSSEKDWLNSPPLGRAELAGKVTLVYFWAFDCWNSYRSFPWLREVEKRFSGRGFQAVGIHTPEFSHEKSRKNLEAKVKEFKLTHPVMMDNSFSYWKRMKNRYWPAFYLTDREGNVVYKMIGETHKGTEKARQFEEVVEGLLSERK